MGLKFEEVLSNVNWIGWA